MTDIHSILSAGLRRDNVMNDGSSSSSSMPNIAALYPDTQHELPQVSQNANCYAITLNIKLVVSNTVIM